MKSVVRIILLTSAISGPLSIAQEPKPTEPAKSETKAEPAQPPTAAPTSDQTFELGRLSAKMEELQTQYSTLVQKIVREHPGYLWDPSRNVLVLAPKPAVAKEKGR